jgi:hypothetical protein
VIREAVPLATQLDIRDDVWCAVVAKGAGRLTLSPRIRFVDGALLLYQLAAIRSSFRCLRVETVEQHSADATQELSASHMKALFHKWLGVGETLAHQNIDLSNLRLCITGASGLLTASCSSFASLPPVDAGAGAAGAAPVASSKLRLGFVATVTVSWDTPELKLLSFLRD